MLFKYNVFTESYNLLRRRFAAQARTERVSRGLKREPLPSPVISVAKRARRALTLIILTNFSAYR